MVLDADYQLDLSKNEEEKADLVHELEQIKEVVAENKKAALVYDATISELRIAASLAKDRSVALTKDVERLTTERNEIKADFDETVVRMNNTIDVLKASVTSR
jgi:chromosome segregation ATPase